MDWFADIAGKAESFLNTLDKEAGAAITNVVQSSQNRNNARRQSIKSDNLNSDKFSDSGSVTQYGSEYIDTPEIQSLKTSPSSTSLISSSTANNNNAQQLLKKPSLHRREGSHSSSGSKNSRLSHVDDNKVKLQIESESESNDFNLYWENSQFNPSEATTTTTTNKTPSTEALQSVDLEKELTNVHEKYSELLKEHKQMQKKFQTQQKQFTNNEKLLRKLQNNENDLKAMLESRENQIEGFKLRLQQYETEIKEKEAYLINLKGFNEELQSQLESNGNESNRSKEDAEIIATLERELEKFKITYRNEQNEAKKTQNMYREQITRLEDAQRSLVEEIENNKKLLFDSKTARNELEMQFEVLQKRYDALEIESSEYKIKAAKTLNDKDEEIRKFYQQKAQINENLQGKSADDDNGNLLIGLKEQCDKLIDEIRQLQIKYKECKDELDKCQNEIIPKYVYEIRKHEDYSKKEKDKCDKLMFDIRTLTENNNRLQIDLEQLRNNLTSRISERDDEIENLRKQLMLKQQRNIQTGASEATPEEWESRLKSLTDNLIQKQASLEQITSSNHSLKVQLERAENRLREFAQKSGSLNSNDVSIGIYHSPAFTSYIKQRMNTADSDHISNRAGSSTSLLEDYPNDNQVTRRVKRAYNAIDTFSIRAGQFLRRTPGARALFLIYIVVLHLFVALILYSYQPEVHLECH